VYARYHLEKQTHIKLEPDPYKSAALCATGNRTARS